MPTPPFRDLPLGAWHGALMQGRVEASDSGKPVLDAALEALSLLAQPHLGPLPDALAAPVDLYEQAVAALAQGGSPTLLRAWACAGEVFLALGARAQNGSARTADTRETEGAALVLRLDLDRGNSTHHGIAPFHLAVAMAKAMPLSLHGQPTGLVVDDVAVIELAPTGYPCGLNLIIHWVPRAQVRARLPRPIGWRARLSTWRQRLQGDVEPVELLQDSCLELLRRTLAHLQQAMTQGA